MKIVAEVGLAHEGSLGMALAYIDACAKAGVDAVKFQCHDFDKVNRFRFGTDFPQDATRQDFWMRTKFTIDQWRLIKDRCHEDNVEFGLSVFAPMAATQFIECHCQPDFWKLGSGVSGSVEMIIAAADRPVVASFGMSTAAEMARALTHYDSYRTTVLHCISEYPCRPENCSYIEPDCRKFGFGVGLSDHSGTIWPGICAASVGADMLEVHVTWSKECFGPDVSSSLTIDELRQLVQGVRFVEKMRANPVDKDAMAEKLKPMREIFCVPH